MQVNILRAKILRAEVTDAKLHYEGSMAIDADILRLVGILPHEKILVGNISNGERFETYAIPAPAGSRTFSLNGATAHLGKVGDLIVIMTFGWLPETDALTYEPRIVVLADANTRIVRLTNPAVPSLTQNFK